MPWTEELPSGRFRGVYRLPDGKKRSAGTFDHEKHAYNAAAAKESEVAKANWRDPSASRQTWGSWVEVWWPTRDVEDSTLRRDQSRLKMHLAPHWNEKPLGDITRHDVRTWAATLKKVGGLSPATVQRCLSLFSASLAAAIDAEILQANPASRLKLKVPDNSSERYLSRDEGGELLAQFPADGVERAIATFMLGTGLRWGEAAGALIKNYYPDKRIYRVREVWDDSGNCMKEYPKGRRRRNVPTPDWVEEELRRVIGDRREGFIFEAAPGVPLDYHNFRNREWTPAVKAAALDPFNIHAMRHSYASWLIQDGVSLEQVGKLLGHLSPLTTRRYAHLADVPGDEILASLTRPAPAVKKVSSIKKGSKHGAGVGQSAVPSDSNVIQFTPRRAASNT